MIPQSFIADLLNRVDVVEIVGRHVTLKKAGANYQGLCPFHQEKSPSFSVSPTKQFYHCFGCGAHGSAISFLMEYSGLGYVDAIEELARSVGVTVPKEERRPQDVMKQKRALALSEVMEPAANYYKLQLKGSERAIAYLKKRGLSGEIAKKFGLGYAPDAWQSLESVFGSYADENLSTVLVEAGLIIQSEEKRYDRFRDRIMFPIRNTKGMVIAFGGRIIDQGEPKYLNSPETPLFSKGNTLYGLFEARQAIREKAYVLVCEGYMDVVALAQLGFANAVATLGTACTANHVRSLMRQTDRIVFSFDGDAAGQRAAKRALEAALPMMVDDKEIKFLFLPSEHDPDSFVREYGAERFELEVKKATSFSNYFLQVVSGDHDLSTPEGRAQTQHDAKPLIMAMPAIALRGQLIKELAKTIGVTPAELETFCGLKSSAGTPGVSPQAIVKKTATTNSTKKSVMAIDLAEQILRLFVQFPSLGRGLSERQKSLLMDVALKRSEKAKELMVDLISQCEQATETEGFALFQEQLDKSPLSKLYEHLREKVMSSEMTLESGQEEFSATLKKLELADLKQEMTQIAEKIGKGLASDEDRNRYRELLTKLK